MMKLINWHIAKTIIYQILNADKGMHDNLIITFE